MKNIFRKIPKAKEVKDHDPVTLKAVTYAEPPPAKQKLAAWVLKQPWFRSQATKYLTLLATAVTSWLVARGGDASQAETIIGAIVAIGLFVFDQIRSKICYNARILQPETEENSHKAKLDYSTFFGNSDDDPPLTPLVPRNLTTKKEHGLSLRGMPSDKEIKATERKLASVRPVWKLKIKKPGKRSRFRSFYSSLEAEKAFHKAAATLPAGTEIEVIEPMLKRKK